MSKPSFVENVPPKDGSTPPRPTGGSDVKKPGKPGLVQNVPPKEGAK